MRKQDGRVVQLDRIPDFGSGGWGFESSRGHQRIQGQRNVARDPSKAGFGEWSHATISAKQNP